MAEYWAENLVQRGERQAELGRGPGRTQHPEPVADRRGGPFQQGRLADTRRAADYQRRTAGGRTVQQPGDQGSLRVSPGERDATGHLALRCVAVSTSLGAVRAEAMIGKAITDTSPAATRAT